MEHVSELYPGGPCGLQADLGFFRGPDGRPYRILALHCNQTYSFSSLLYGIPKPDHNEKALAASREHCAKLGPSPL